MGAQALSIVALTHLYGVEQEAAVAASMVLWIITFASCSLVGIPLRFTRAKALAEELVVDRVLECGDGVDGGGDDEDDHDHENGNDDVMVMAIPTMITMPAVTWVEAKSCLCRR